MLFKASNRWQAFGLHLVISLLIFLVLAAVIYFWWYPGFLFRYDGGLKGMQLIAGVDMVIGPLLTLLVFKLGKPSLRFDLTCIALLQISCLAGGMWTVWQTRPIAVVYAAGSFAVTNQRGYEAEGYEWDKIEMLQSRWPIWLAVKLPEADVGALGAVWALMGSGLQYNVAGYVPYADVVAELSSAGQRATEVKSVRDDLKSIEQKNPQVRFFPVTTSMYEGYLAVDTSNGEVLTFVEQQ